MRYRFDDFRFQPTKLQTPGNSLRQLSRSGLVSKRRFGATENLMCSKDGAVSKTQGNGKFSHSSARVDQQAQVGPSCSSEKTETPERVPKG